VTDGHNKKPSSYPDNRPLCSRHLLARIRSCRLARILAHHRQTDRQTDRQTYRQTHNNYSRTLRNVTPSPIPTFWSETHRTLKQWNKTFKQPETVLGLFLPHWHIFKPKTVSACFSVLFHCFISINQSINHLHVLAIITWGNVQRRLSWRLPPIKKLQTLNLLT